ncbi:MAG: hypothetical protein NZ651_05025 [Candidatus Bipolaricaulota bacterium]|nr:hypothetical protein [Candidatus Bipolaricaulota bacterium]MDW8127116.1 hypothetical protein [Candidatus Bipolaricaulota bacterium]
MPAARAPIEIKEVKIITPPEGKKGVAPVFAPTTALEMARQGALPGDVARAVVEAGKGFPGVEQTRIVAIPAAHRPEELNLVYKHGAGWVRVKNVTSSPANPSALQKALEWLEQRKKTEKKPAGVSIQ